MTLRTSGLDLTLVSLYLQCSSGLSGKVNSKILAALIDVRLQVKGPVVVGGDWNCPIQEFLGMNICRAFKLRVLGTGRPTSELLEEPDPYHQASGVLPRPATILDGEVYAIRKALERGSRPTSIRKVLTSELWRRRLNIAAHELAGRLQARADRAVTSDAVAQVRRADHLISTLSQYLSQKAEILLTTQNKKDLFRKKDSKPRSFNKRRQIEASVEPGADVLEHQWEIGSKHLSNLTARCGKCGLWTQQVDPPSIFQQTLAQPCLGQPSAPSEHFGLRSSHSWVSIGVGWQCKGCERIIKARAKSTSSLAAGR